jgi:multicomponent Na+:H+ antiporter subunit G
MGVRDVVVWILLGLAALTVVLSAVGLVAARDTIPRLHFLTPVTSVAAPLTGVAYVVDQGLGLAGGLVLGIVAVLAATGPPLGSAIGRVAAVEEGLLPPGTTQ